MTAKIRLGYNFILLGNQRRRQARQAVMTPEKQQQVLNQIFSGIYGQLSELLGRFGGKPLQENLKQLFLTLARGKGFSSSGGINLADADIDWAGYRNLMTRLIDFSAGAVGKNQLEKAIGGVIGEVEKSSGEGLYETCFKLGIHRYVGNR